MEFGFTVLFAGFIVAHQRDRFRGWLAEIIDCARSLLRGSESTECPAPSDDENLSARKNHKLSGACSTGAAGGRGRHFIPTTPVEDAAGSGFEHSAPLLEEKRYSSARTAIANLANPGGIDRARPRPGFATHDYPIDPAEVQFAQGAEQGFDAEKFDARSGAP